MRISTFRIVSVNFFKKVEIDGSCFHQKYFHFLVFNVSTLIMSTVNIDDLQCISSDEHIQSSQLNNIVVTHQFPSNSIQINTQDMQNPSRMLSSFNGDSEIMSIAVVYDRTSSHQSFTSNIREVREYTIWSIFTTLFCCFLIGGFAFHTSCCTKKKKHRGHLILAQNFSKMTILLNIVATISGLIIFTLVILRYTGRIAI